MKTFSKADLKNLRPSFDTFVGIDSDGCVFDTMEIKQKDFFHPAIIRHWHLEAIEPQVRAAAEFTYLYSQSRGLNRFLGLCRVFELLLDWPEACEGATLPDPSDLQAFCKLDQPLSNETILAEAKRINSKLLLEIYNWSVDLNERIDREMPPPPVFSGAEAGLKKIAAHSDAIVISQTQAIALLKDWYRDGLAQYVSVIAGPELGNKVDHFKMAAVDRYPAKSILMIGDAPGDLAAATEIGCNFFPINPGHESESWQQFMDEGYELFLAGGFSSVYQKQLNDRFNAYLPDSPPWKN